MGRSRGFGGGEAPPTRVRSLFQKKLPRGRGPSRSRGGFLLSSSDNATPQQARQNRANWNIVKLTCGRQQRAWQPCINGAGKL